MCKVKTALDLANQLAKAEHYAAMAAEIEQQNQDWWALMAKIAVLDPSWTKDMEEPDPDDPQFQEQYDPWGGLRLVTRQIERLTRERDEALADLLHDKAALSVATVERDDALSRRSIAHTAVEIAERQLYEANAAGARVTEAYKALREQKPLGHRDATVESYDVADWPYPPDWEAEKEWSKTQEENIQFLDTRLKKSMEERDEARILRKKAEAAQVVMVGALERLRDHHTLGLNQITIRDTAMSALTAVTPEAARMRRIVEAAEEETDMEDEWKVGATHKETCAFRAKEMRVRAARRKAVRREEKP